MQPPLLGCGVAHLGTKEAAIDFMLSKKLVAKLEGRFEEYVKGSLGKLVQLLQKTYGPGVMKRTEQTATTIMKAL